MNHITQHTYLKTGTEQIVRGQETNDLMERRNVSLNQYLRFRN